MKNNKYFRYERIVSRLKVTTTFEGLQNVFQSIIDVGNEPAGFLAGLLAAHFRDHIDTNAPPIKRLNSVNPTKGRELPITFLYIIKEIIAEVTKEFPCNYDGNTSYVVYGTELKTKSGIYVATFASEKMANEVRGLLNSSKTPMMWG